MFASRNIFLLILMLDCKFIGVVLSVLSSRLGEAEKCYFSFDVLPPNQRLRKV